MTASEFSTEFDVLYNNITSNQAPGLNLYEKSVFLTKAQSQLMSEYFNEKLDGSEGGFDGSPKRQIDLSSIMEWDTLERITQSAPRFDPRSVLYAMPENALFIVDEQLSLLDYNNISYSQADTDTFYSVVPVSYEEYARLMAKPYKYPPKSQAWRLLTKKFIITTQEEIIPVYYTLIHTQTAVYANIDGTYKLVFTLEYDSNSDDDDPVNVAIATTGFDPEPLVGYIVAVVPDMGAPISSIVDILKSKGLNNLKVKVESAFKDKRWRDFWSVNTIIIQATNNGSIYHEEQTIPSETKVVQLLEIIGKFPSTPYYRMRYVRRPKPIIIEPRLDSLGVSIEGIGDGDGKTYTYPEAPEDGEFFSTISECELPEEMHHEILERAVTLAKIAWQGATMTQTALAVQASE